MEGDVNGRMMNTRKLATNSSSSSNESLITSTQVVEEEDQEDVIGDLRRGPWTVEEDFNLINYIASHGEGRWNSLARSSGLRRTGKSCRLRWLNYLRPDLRRGNITLEEQLMILELHSQWGNRWSKIAQHLPGRTDNEIKNYWRTRVQKHAKQLKCDVNSKQFKDAMRYLWMPRLIERIQAAAAASSSNSTTPPSANVTSNINVTPGGGNGNTSHLLINTINGAVCGNPVMTPRGFVGSGLGSNISYTPDNSSTSDSLDAHVSDLATDYYNNNVAFTQTHNADYNFQSGQVGHYYAPSINSPGGYCFNQEFDFEAMDQHRFDLGETSDKFWNAEDIWFVQQQSNNNNNM